MADPQPIGTPVEFWVDYTKLDSEGQPTISTTPPPPDNPGGWFGIGGSHSSAVHITRVTYDTGEIYDFTDDGKATYVKTDSQLATAYRTSQPKEAAPYRFQDNQGNFFEYDSSQTDANGKPKVTQIFQQPQTLEDPDLAALKKQQLQAQIAATQRSNAGPQGPSAWEQSWKERDFAYQQEQDLKAREERAQTLAQQKKRDAWTMASDSLAGQLKATDIAAMPGQEYYLGHEPGGVSESIARKLGVAYNPEAWRIKTIPYDPEAEWQKAWARTNGQG
jgi:hypothetical protein